MPVTSTGMTEGEGRAVDLSVVVCTLNEAGAIGPVLRELLTALSDIDSEVVVVDDASSDGTPDAVRALGDPRIRLVERRGVRGLASAAITGWDAARGAHLALMDGDGQHDPALVPAMLARARAGAPLVVASRYTGSGPSGLTGGRHWLSRAGTRVAGLALGARLSDPMSGCFLMTRGFYETVRLKLSGVGFKILVDLVASAKSADFAKFVPVFSEPIAEVPTALRTRIAGASKLDVRVALELAALVVDKRTGGLLPARFLLFAGVGVTGTLIQLWGFLLFDRFGAPFALAQAGGILLAMTWNFQLNNLLTFRDHRLQGAAWFRGWLTFAVACAAGAVINLLVGAGLHRLGTYDALANLTGALAGGVWNFVASRRATWGVRSQSAT